MSNPICLWLTLWRSLRHLRHVSGCDSVTVPETPENVHVIKCQGCGNHSVAWSWDSLEDQK